MAGNQSNKEDTASSSSSSRRRGTFNTLVNNVVIAWSHLNHDLLFLVMIRLGVIDFVSFSGVCKSWRSVALDNRKQFLASKPPLLMWLEKSTNPHEDIYCYLTDDREEIHIMRTDIPDCKGKKYLGLASGFLIIFGKKSQDFWLINPLTRQELHFPTNPLFVGHPILEKFKGVLVCSPTTSKWMFIMLCNDIISFSVEGKPTWYPVKCKDPVLDIIVSKGIVYVLHNKFSLSVLRFSLERRMEGMLHDTKIFQNPPELNNPVLVNLDENLYVMDGYTKPSKIIKLDFDVMKMVAPDNTIEEYAFYITHHPIVIGISANVTASKLDSWTGIWESNKREHTVETGQRMVTYIGEWYFPSGC